MDGKMNEHTNDKEIEKYFKRVAKKSVIYKLVRKKWVVCR